MLQQCHFLLQVRFVWCSFATLIDLSNKHSSLAVFHLVRTCSNKMLCCCKLSCWCILLKCTHVDNKACLLCANKCMHTCMPDVVLHTATCRQSNFMCMACARTCECTEVFCWKGGREVYFVLCSF